MFTNTTLNTFSRTFLASTLLVPLVSLHVQADERYLATQCKTIEGDVRYNNYGRIANASETDTAIVQCPVDTQGLYVTTHVTFQDLNPQAGQNVECFTLGRTSNYIGASDVRSSAIETTVDVDADGYSGSTVDTMSMDEVYLSVVGGGALIECSIPPATGPNAAHRSKLYVYRAHGR